MSYLPQFYFGDIPAEQMKEIMDDMEVSDEDLALAVCESRNHREHRGEIWQCTECLRLLCWEEGANDRDADLCDDCRARLGSRTRAVCFA